MKKTIFILTILFSFTTNFIFGQSKSEVYANYIIKYSKLAVEHQKKYKIPASITLAQGLLESGAGTSRLAKEGNNHFGIKCNRNWTGETIKNDDDRKDECFRKYRSPEESYEDHALFLSIHPRYAPLFKLNPTDYKAWAYGLKNANYATDRNYAHKLIRIIEDFDLHKYDVGQKASIKKMVSVENKKTYRWETTGEPIALTGHTVYKNNGVKCIITEAGDSFDAIANEFRKSKKKILRYNDLAEERPLKPKTIIYIAKKKKKAEKQFTYHEVKKGDSMYKIAQKYAIRLQKLYDINNITYDQKPKVGDILVLR